MTSGRRQVIAWTNDDQALWRHWPKWIKYFVVFLVNPSTPKQDGRHFSDDIFKCIFLNGNGWIVINISLMFVPKSSTDNVPALVQIMAWRRPGWAIVDHYCVRQSVFTDAHCILWNMHTVLVSLCLIYFTFAACVIQIWRGHIRTIPLLHMEYASGECCVWLYSW